MDFAAQASQRVPRALREALVHREADQQALLAPARPRRKTRSKWQRSKESVFSILNAKFPHLRMDEK
jgi:hypothetical protein